MAEVLVELIGFTETFAYCGQAHDRAQQRGALMMEFSSIFIAFHPCSVRVLVRVKCQTVCDLWRIPEINPDLNGFPGYQLVAQVMGM